jgi:glycosyltransferase involved in cell wall biosynthesis
MRIGFDAKRLFNNFTGLGNYSRTLIKDLIEITPYKFFLYTPKFKSSNETKDYRNADKYQVKTSNKLLWRVKGIVKDLKQDGIKLYHGLSNEIPFGINKSGIKSVVTIHDLIFKIYPKTYNFFDSKIYDIKFKYACENADKIIAISESTKKDIVRFYNVSPLKIEVIYQACNPLFYELQSKQNVASILNKYSLPQKFMLYVGSIIERKNLLTIVKAQDRLNKDLRIPLVIVGKGDSYKQKVQDYIKTKEISDHFIWVDNLSDNHHLQAFYQAAEVFIYPSVYEGFGIPVVEALLSKTPVITSNLSSLPEAGGPNSICINPTDVNSMIKSIENVLSKKELRSRMVEKGYAYAKSNFDGKICAEKVLKVYQEVLK